MISAFLEIIRNTDTPGWISADSQLHLLVEVEEETSMAEDGKHTEVVDAVWGGSIY